MKVDDGTPRDGSSGREEHPHEMLSALLDGELDHAEQAAVENHLRACGACRALLGDLRRLAEATRMEPAPPIPADMGARIRRRLRADAAPARPARRRVWLSPFPLGAVAGLLVAVAILTPWYLTRVATRRIEPAMVEEAGPRASLERATAVEPRPEGAAAAPAIVAPPAAAPAPAPPAAHMPRRAAGAPRQPSGTTEGKETDDAAAKPIVTAFQAEAVSGARGVTGATSGPSPRTLRLITPSYRAEIVEDGRLTIETEGYSCTVAIPPAPGPPPARPPESRLADRGREEDPLALAALFALAAAPSSREVPVPRPEALWIAGAEPPGGAATEAGPAAPGRIVVEDPGGRILSSVPYDDAQEEGMTPQTRELGRRIDRLVRERHRALIESSCGPLPGALRRPG